ncbi:hypothetical protein NTE_03391 [Candidatus Nitrososphaera evergladensis SR1]|uniref:Uncharacterized protein n=1 Tax=Candidatus Nitrososphaera evergladensis SR1 TaxID=1459636 RepID=A0A075N1T6_9ARCH|nr:hypothetical protein [Candidatus Nitrososphaera evergladensis]AIF85419.1 hypothetical protein NTE_03391 [Candidatus Nitrososphaera evergladensis SR1]
MADQREFLNAKKGGHCDHCGSDGLLFVQRVVSGHSERYYGYVKHPAEFEDSKQVATAKRCYVGLLSKYITGRTCDHCGRRCKFSECYKCSRKRRAAVAA